LNTEQCVGSGSPKSATFWLPGSVSTKIFRSTDPDPRGKISTTGEKIEPKTKILTVETREYLKFLYI